ncbi:TetR family transcriptional regulator [Skermanella aerolata]|uniref:TetR family transcriptional regulator n=1 Tax=Skermanella aerolata TaxID=393310 RepID=A0A512DVH2_9PROT|nr:TetR/AcrR family transcriptional regulator [Skermanella aerolata]KJB94916.1 TetR family transcriptional regulator [Skermanella aerolata KACC 11604]GEO40465.1 TetR family transcriptional regulator [Skermanella aerolata]
MSESDGTMTMTPDACARACGPRGDARRRAILDAAWTLFLEKGFERTTLGDIIALSGGSRSTLYEQFGDKDGLFETAIMLKCSEFIERMRQIPLDGGDPERTLTEFGMNFTECVLSPESPKFLRLLIASGDQFPQVIDAFFQGAPDAVRQILSDYLREATVRGQLRVTDPDHAATTFLGFLHGDQHLKMLLRPERLATPAELKKFVEGVVRIFLDGVR